MQKKYFYIIGIILLICYYPLLFPGYIFSLDQAFPYAYTSVPQFGQNNYWLHIIGIVFTQLGIPTWILEKFVYIMMFGITGIYGYKLLQKTQSDIAITFGILFLFLNPFFYARFVEGQVNIYLSYILFIPFIYYIIEFFHHKKYTLWKYIAPLSLLLCLTSIHNIFIIGAIISIFSCTYLLISKKKKVLLKYLGIVGVSIIGLNSFWIIPTTNQENLTKQIASFGVNHQKAFQSPPGDYGVYVNLLSLRGYWGEGEKRFIQAELENNYYILGVILLYILLGVGTYTLWKDKNSRILIMSTMCVGCISYILALGTSANNIFSGFNSFLTTYIPYYSGFREPQKWLFIYALIFTFISSYGVSTILQFIKGKNKGIFLGGITLCIIAFPILYTPATLFGHWGQLRPKLYPIEWQEIQKITYNTEYIDSCTTEKCYSSIIFPWHGYIHIDWTETPITLSGISRYFSPHALIGDTLEIRNIYTQSTRPESKIIESYIAPFGYFRNEYSDTTIENFIGDLKDLGISQIILLREADYSWYENILNHMEEKSQIQIVNENDMVILYKIQ